MGSVSSGTCVPAGFTRQPLFSRNPPPGSEPTCSRGAGCEEDTSAAIASSDAGAAELDGGA